MFKLGVVFILSLSGLLGCSPHFGSSIRAGLTSTSSHAFSSQSVAQPYYAEAMPILSSSQANVTAVGLTELVYDSHTEGCAGAELDIPDTPTQAYRDASGNTIITISHFTGNHRDIGPDLDHVQHSCQPTFASKNDPKFADDLYHQWISATYSIDGTNVVALVHNEWYPGVNQPKRCTSGWVNSIDFISSSDGGASFQVPDDYKVRTPGTPWVNTFDCQDDDNETVYGSFLPSGITDGHDGYYYSFFRAIAAPNKVGSTGECVMRASNLNSGSDWNVWTGSDWQPASQTPNCGVINFPGMNADFAGWINVKFSTYFGKFIVLMDSKLDNSDVRLHYALSDDLIHWSAAIPLANEIHTSADPDALPQYFSFLDPDDTSRNYENIGSDPYIYFVIWGQDNLDRQVVRQRIHFDGIPVPPPLPIPVAGSVTTSAAQGSAQNQTTVVVNNVQAAVQAEAQLRADADQAAQAAQAAVQAAAQTSAAAAAVQQAVAARQMQVVYRYASPRGYHAFFLTSDGTGVPANFALEGAVFSVYVAPYANTTALYRCNTNGHQFLSVDANCEGQNMGGLLGYVATVQAGNLQPLYRMNDNGDYLEANTTDEGVDAGYAIEGILGFTP